MILFISTQTAQSMAKTTYYDNRSAGIFPIVALATCDEQEQG
jgi:hypothetical protein